MGLLPRQPGSPVGGGRSRHAAPGGGAQFEDGITVNYGGDYPGGVTVEGDVEMRKSLVVGNASMEFTSRIPAFGEAFGSAAIDGSTWTWWPRS